MNHIPEATIGEINLATDLHPFADWTREQVVQVEQEVIVLTNEQLLERRQQEWAQSRWW